MAYRHLTSTDRTYIEVLHGEGHSFDEIGLRVGKHKSTVSRELKRNVSTGIAYKAEFAQFHTSRRTIGANKQRRKIQDGSALERHILEKLRLRWSPDEIRGKLKQQVVLPSICNETIYTFIKKRRPEFKQYLLILSHKRYRKRGSGKREIILNRRMIDERPKAIEARKKTWALGGRHRREYVSQHSNRDVRRTKIRLLSGRENGESQRNGNEQNLRTVV